MMLPRYISQTKMATITRPAMASVPTMTPISTLIRIRPYYIAYPGCTCNFAGSRKAPEHTLP